MPHSLAESLVAARERAGLSQARAAQRLGMKQPQLSKLETGVNTPGAEMLSRLAEAYDTTVGALLGESTDAKAGESLPGKVVVAPGEPILIDPVTFGRLYERMEMTAEMVELLDGQHAATSRTLHGIAESVDAVRATLRSLADGVRTAIRRDLPVPPQARGPSRDETLAIAAAGGIRPPAAPPTAASDR